MFYYQPNFTKIIILFLGFNPPSSSCPFGFRFAPSSCQLAPYDYKTKDNLPRTSSRRLPLFYSRPFIPSQTKFARVYYAFKYIDCLFHRQHATHVFANKKDSPCKQACGLSFYCLNLCLLLCLREQQSKCSQSAYYSNSIVAGGFPVQSYSTLLIPLTSFTILLVTFPRISQGSSALSAVMKSVVVTALKAIA